VGLLVQLVLVDGVTGVHGVLQRLGVVVEVTRIAEGAPRGIVARPPSGVAAEAGAVLVLAGLDRHARTVRQKADRRYTDCPGQYPGAVIPAPEPDRVST
jgi:hypothetical protein